MHVSHVHRANHPETNQQEKAMYPNDRRPPAVIVDVDGTLVDVRSLRHLVTGRIRKFDKFHRASIDCPPNLRAVEFVHHHANLGHAILIVTSRRRAHERVTSMWLALHEIPSGEMHMRRDGDFRPDYVVKNEILNSLRMRWDIVGAIDDNPNVIRLWQEHNIPVTVMPGWDDNYEEKSHA